jgi:CheY-like chemotaxis protein
MEPATILLAEDNLVLGLFVKRVLQRAGYRVWFCMDVSEAWQYYADKKPDLVLLDDNRESEMNAKLAKKIRRENKIIPILFLSGNAFSEKGLLKHLYDMLPASKRVTHVPAYDHQYMKLCSPEDILILTTFFEESIHLGDYILN